MREKRVIREQDVLLFNVFREGLKGKELSRNEMLDAIHRELGYARHDAMLKALHSGVNPPIIRVARGRYCVAKEPVYIQRLQTAFDEYKKYTNPRHYTTGNYMRVSIEEAIQVLKEAGYKVLKPFTQYEEI